MDTKEAFRAELRCCAAPFYGVESHLRGGTCLTDMPKEGERFMKNLFLILAVTITSTAIADTRAELSCQDEATSIRTPRINADRAYRLCRHTTSNAPVACVVKASTMSNISIDIENAVQLCTGAQSNAPAFCAQTASNLRDPPLTLIASVWLCRGATSNEPVECVKDAYRFDDKPLQEALRICN